MSHLSFVELLGVMPLMCALKFISWNYCRLYLAAQFIRSKLPQQFNIKEHSEAFRPENLSKSVKLTVLLTNECGDDVTVYSTK